MEDRLRDGGTKDRGATTNRRGAPGALRVRDRGSEVGGVSGFTAVTGGASRHAGPPGDLDYAEAPMPQPLIG